MQNKGYADLSVIDACIELCDTLNGIVHDHRRLQCHLKVIPEAEIFVLEQERRSKAYTSRSPMTH